MDKTEINCSASNHKSVTNVNASAWKPSTIHKSAHEASSGVCVNKDYSSSRDNLFKIFNGTNVMCMGAGQLLGRKETTSKQLI